MSLKIKTQIRIILILQICIPFWGYAQNSISGIVKDAKDKLPIPGVVIYFPDLRTGTITNSDGSYLVKNLPNGKFSISIKYMGYTTQNLSIEINGNIQKDFELSEGVVESKEFIVTGVSQATERSRTPTPVSLVPKAALLENTSTNIIDALAKQPGIAQLSTGQGISKPVIRGLGYNRVVVVNDGIRQEGQQWGDEHGIEIDEYSVNNVEILKGPASLSYGSDAMAGVINFISAPTALEGEIKGNFMSNYQTNNSLLGYSANVSGNQKGVVWDARISRKISGNYKNKYDGKVLNSGFKENNFTGLFGLTKKWGYSHLHLSYYDLSIGLPEGDRDSLSGKFLKQVAINDSSVATEIASQKDLNAYDFAEPRQKINHVKMVWNNSIVVGRGRIGATVGFQQNTRKEFGDVLAPKQYGLYFLLNSINYDLRYIFPEKNNWNLATGINGMQQTSRNKGIEYLIPEYDLFDAGVFLIVKKSIQKLDISGGLRYDTRTEKGAELYLDSLGVKSSVNESHAARKFERFNLNFAGISGSIGGTYQFTESVFAKINISRGYRAPAISELASNGMHEGTLRYELGNVGLKPETSLQTDIEFGINKDHISLEVDVFNNRINNFIFPVKLLAQAGGDSISEGLSTFKYVAGTANLFGAEMVLDLHPHPLDWLHFENSFSIVNAQQLHQPDSMRYLPFTPAPKLRSELKASGKSLGKKVKNCYAKMEFEYYFAQTNIYSAANTESTTPQYFLIHAGLGTDVVNKSKKVLFSFYFSASNITNVAYQSHLSRLKYAPENYASGRNGIFNMGRNFSFKLLIPIAFKQNN